MKQPCRATRLALVAILTLPLGAAVPTINAVFNEASSSSRLNPGCQGHINGNNFGANLAAGTTVTVGSVNAYITLVQPTFLIFQIPWTLPLGPTTVTVTVPGNGSSTPYPITLIAYAPTFQYPGPTFMPPGPVAASHSGLTSIGPGSTARPNQTIGIDLIGMGPTNPPGPFGNTYFNTPYVTTTMPAMTINNEAVAPASILFSGLLPGYVSIFQVKLRVPGDTKPGLLPVALTIGGATTDPGSLYFGPIERDFAATGNSGAMLYDPTNGQEYTALSNGDGTYQYVPNLYTSGFDTLRTGDFNGDGKTDVVVYNSHTALAYIGLGNGNGTFTFQSLFWSPGYDVIEAGDIDGDGKTDFALYNSSTGTLYTAISNGSGGFTYLYHLVSSGFSFVRLADTTGAGKADLVLYNKTNGYIYVGVGDGAGNFNFVAGNASSGYDLGDLGDLNGDGKADLILYNSSNGNAFTAISGGAVTNLLFSPGFTSVKLADFTGDGKADITLYSKNTGVAYFGSGDGAGNFTFQSLFWSPGYDLLVPQDLNGDGKTDVILYNSATGTEYSGLSNGNGTFAYTYSLWGPNKMLAR